MQQKGREMKGLKGDILMIICLGLVAVFGFTIPARAFTEYHQGEELPEVKALPIEKRAPKLIIEEYKLEEKAEPQISERDMMAAVVMAESGGEKFIGKVAVAAVILNRSKVRGISIPDIITETDQFVYPYYGTVSTACYEAVDYALEHRDLFPVNMIYFRNTKFHENFGEPYLQIGGHYFSTDGEPEWELETLGKKD